MTVATTLGVIAAEPTNPVDYINPVIGNSAQKRCGRTIPGPHIPFGLVQLSPDTVTGKGKTSGYNWYDKTIEGFSVNRMPGVGYHGSLGNFQVMPTTGKILFHSCGAVYPLIEHLIEIGVDVLNPLQPLATGMDPLLIKNQFGDRLSFCGAIDIQKALPGSREEVELEVKTRIAQMGPGGGYILAPANYIQNNTPAENVVHLCRMAREYGVYPLA